MTAPSADVEPVTPPSPITKLIKKVPLNLLRFWWAFVLVPGLAIAVAAVGAGSIASTSWTFATTILYAEIPIEEAAEKLYKPPDLKTLATMITSPVVLESVCEELKLEVPPSTLAKMVTIEEPKSMQRIGLELSWADPEEGRVILDKIASHYGDHISGIRRTTVAGYLSDLTASLDRNSRRLGTAQEALRAFNSRENIRDAESDMTQLLQSISSLDFKLGTERRRTKDLSLQEQSMKDRLDAQKNEELLASEKAKDAEAAEESVADNRRRQDRLNELIVEERRLNEIRASLYAKQQEFDRKLKLYEKGYISRADFEVVDAEVKGLKSRIMEGDNITKWKSELATIDKVVVPSGGKKRKGSPVIQQTLFKLIEIQLDILQANSEINQLRVDIVERQKRISRLQELKQESTRLSKEIDAAANERDSLNTQQAALQSIHDYGPYEFSIIAPASSAMHNPSSNKKKLFILFFGGVTVVLSAPFALLAVLLSFKQSVDEGCTDCGLPILSPRKSLLAALTDSPADTQADSNRWARHVALRIQQLLPKHGTVLSVFPASHRRMDLELILLLAQVLVDRDERVLIIESSAAQESLELRRRRQIHGEPIDAAHEVLRDAASRFGKTGAGLFDYLHEYENSVEPLIRTDGISGADFLPIGQNHGRFDRLFSRRMNQLVELARSKYSIVIIYGPELYRTVDVEIQTRHSDGAIFLHDRGEPLSHGIKTTLDSLLELKAPVWGSLLRPAGYAAPQVPRLAKRVVRQLGPLLSRLAGGRQQKTANANAKRSRIARVLAMAITPFKRVLVTLRKTLQKSRTKTRPDSPGGSPEPADAPGTEPTAATPADSETNP